MSRLLPIGGLAAAALALASVLVDPEAALLGWLAAFAFWAGVPIGALVLLMIARLAPGGWSDQLAIGTAALLLPLVAVAALPLALGFGVLYPWADGDAAGHGFRAAWLTPGLVSLRTAAFLGAGLAVALMLLRPGAGRAPAAIGLIALVPFHSVIAYDWLVSLNPEFHSSGFGLYLLSIHVSTALAVLMLIRLASPGERAPAPLGALLLTALLLWGYFAFMQYFIIWSSNLPSGVAWYELRAAAPWPQVFSVVAALHATTLFLLLFPPFRRSPRWLAGFAVATLTGKALEAAWLTLPEGSVGAVAWAALALALALLGLGALGAAAWPFAARRARRSRQAGRGREVRP